MREFGPEQGIHGWRWELIHDGYFSDPLRAASLVTTIFRIWQQTRPEYIVDLGGGTGFLLLQLREIGIGEETVLINLDSSEDQIAVAKTVKGIETIKGTVEDFSRADLIPAGCRAMYVMRSVLHYFGEEGLVPLLQHLRRHAEPGEMFVHQSACFDRAADAKCLNTLYRRLRTIKWYPTVMELKACLDSTGWDVESVSPMPALRLLSEDLSFRYGLTTLEIQRVREAMTAEFGALYSVYRQQAEGFEAFLHYRLFVCRAV